MAIVSGGDFRPIRMDQLDISYLIDGDPIEQSPITFALDKGAGITVTWRGLGFLYGAADDPLGLVDRLINGMLFQLTLTAGGATFMDIRALTTPLKKFAEAARANDDAAALGIAFVGEDTLHGSVFDDVLHGYGGHDQLSGGEGADTLRGGAGNDHIFGQSALGGADGNDSLAGEDGNDYLQGNVGNDILDGGAGTDRIQGGQGNDRIFGGTGDDSANGNRGNDTIDGGSGNDLLRGGQDDDSLAGGAGNDTLIGDLGSDTLNGGAGADHLIFGGISSLISDGSVDLISGFQNGSDRIGVGYVVEAVLDGGRQPNLAAAATAAQAAFDGRAGNGEVAVVAVGGDAYIFYSSVGRSMADSAIQLSRISAIQIDIDDFI